jgi:hypothetical protein
MINNIYDAVLGSWGSLSSVGAGWWAAGAMAVVSLLLFLVLAKVSLTTVAFKREFYKIKRTLGASQAEFDRRAAEVESVAEKRILEVKMIADREVRGASNRTRPFDVEKDMEFLLFIIDVKVSQAIKYRLEPELRQGEKRRPLLRDDNLETISEEIVGDVMSTLSDVYKREAVGRYIAEKALIGYVAETVYVSLLSEVIAINDNQIRRIKASSRMKQIREDAVGQGRAAAAAKIAAGNKEQ